MNDQITKEQLRYFTREGYVRLGQVASNTELDQLCERIDDIMLGIANVNYDKMMMQLDSSNGLGTAPGPQSYGFKGATLGYRKIQDLENDDLFLQYLKKPLFKSICKEIYGLQTRIACFRAMFMNKPAGDGTHLVWHQDRWTNLDRDPKVTIWTALDQATVANGCVHIVPKSHQRLINDEHGSGFLTADQIEEMLNKSKPQALELQAGEVVLLHNWLLHSSDTNNTDLPRRAFSVCYIDAATRAQNGHVFPVVFEVDKPNVKSDICGNELESV